MELRKGLEKVKDVLYDNMGWGHCIATDGRTVELWWEDPGAIPTAAEEAIISFNFETDL